MIARRRSTPLDPGASEAAADNNRFIYRNFAGGTPETDGDHGA